MRSNREYLICKSIAQYMRLKYPKVLYHFDLSGLNLSRAQAGMMSAIQGGRGWPDFFIVYPRNGYSGLFLEIKSEGTRLYNKKFEAVTPHIGEQAACLDSLRCQSFKADFAIGLDDCISKIDHYMTDII